MKSQKKVLAFVAPQSKGFDNIKENEIIYNLDGSIAFYVYER